MEDGLTMTTNPGSDTPFEAAKDFHHPGLQSAPTSVQLTMKPLTEMTKKIIPRPWAEGESIHVFHSIATNTFSRR
eukprot:COSAG02_NODE_1631_length_11575_cov_5.514639_4_plen_75_part_00